jgi:hypothetical protein
MAIRLPGNIYRYATAVIIGLMSSNTGIERLQGGQLPDLGRVRRWTIRRGASSSSMFFCNVSNPAQLWSASACHAVLSEKQKRGASSGILAA